jgi:hypothetical protein
MLAAAAAYLVPQHAVRGVSLDTRPPAIVRVLGRPDRKAATPVVGGPATLWTYGKLRITVIQGGGVVQLETRDRRDRTRNGVGVGSSEAAVVRGVPGVRCLTEGGIRHCHLGSYTAGHIVTDFFLTRGHVTRIVVGRVLD